MANGGAFDSITVVGVATIVASSSYNFKCQRLDGANGSNLQWEYAGDPTRTLQTNRGNNGIYLPLSNVGQSAVGLYRCKDGSTNEAEELLLTVGMCTHTYVRTCVVCVSEIVQFLVQVVAVVSTTHSYLQDIPVFIRVAHIPIGEGCSKFITERFLPCGVTPSTVTVKQSVHSVTVSASWISFHCNSSEEGHC